MIREEKKPAFFSKKKRTVVVTGRHIIVFLRALVVNPNHLVLGFSPFNDLSEEFLF